MVISLLKLFINTPMLQIQVHRFTSVRFVGINHKLTMDAGYSVRICLCLTKYNKFLFIPSFLVIYAPISEKLKYVLSSLCAEIQRVLDAVGLCIFVKHVAAEGTKLNVHQITQQAERLQRHTPTQYSRTIRDYFSLVVQYCKTDFCVGLHIQFTLSMSCLKSNSISSNFTLLGFYNMWIDGFCGY